MQISQLPASNSFSSSDVIAVEINDVTYKLTGATLVTALKTLGNYVSKTGDTMTGALSLAVSSATQMILSQGDNSGATVNLIAQTNSATSQLRFREYAPGGTLFEDYRLPSAESSLSASAGYDIYTSKNPPVIYRDYSFSETLAANAVLHKRVDSSGIAVSGYTPIGALVIQTTTNILSSTVMANIYNGTQAFLHITNGGAQQTITGTVRVAYVKNT